jgi:hypothetical protein
MMRRLAFGFLALTFAATLGFVASCAENTSDNSSNPRVSTPAGAASNPQMAAKKQSGGS